MFVSSLMWTFGILSLCTLPLFNSTTNAFIFLFLLFYFLNRSEKKGLKKRLANSEEEIKLVEKIKNNISLATYNRKDYTFSPDEIYNVTGETSFVKNLSALFKVLDRDFGSERYVVANLIPDLSDDEFLEVEVHIADLQVGYLSKEDVRKFKSNLYLWEKLNLEMTCKSKLINKNSTHYSVIIFLPNKLPKPNILHQESTFEIL